MERFIRFTAILIVLGSSSAQAATNCEEISFALGDGSREVMGEAPPDDVLCFIIRTTAGQQARIQLLEGSNTIVTVPGVPEAEARQEISFIAQSRAYELLVGQLMRALEPEPFRMRVSVQ